MGEELRDENCDVDTALRKRIEMFLDQGYGECWLRNPAVARKVQDSFLFFPWRTLSTNGLGCHAKSCTPAFDSCGRTRTFANSSLAEVVHCTKPTRSCVAAASFGSRSHSIGAYGTRTTSRTQSPTSKTILLRLGFANDRKIGRLAARGFGNEKRNKKFALRTHCRQNVCAPSARSQLPSYVSLPSALLRGF